MLPLARRAGLTVRELPEETLVYDHARHKAHCLNATARLVWRHCNGQMSIEELADVVARATGVAPAPAVVMLALEQLGRRQLLEPSVEPATAPLSDRLSRREALKKFAIAAAAALPLILTVTTKAAAQSMSDVLSSPTTTTSAAPVQVTIPIVVSTGGSGSGSGGSKSTKPGTAGNCRSQGQSCVAAASGQQGTCCPGLRCNGVVSNAGVCG